MNTLQDPRIAQFSSLVNQGIKAWQDAGLLLVEISRDNPTAHLDIIQENPHLTHEILEAFERVGKRELYPMLLVDGSPGARRLAGLPYDQQERYFHNEVSVAVRRSTGLQTVKRRVFDLTPTEADRVFDSDRIRPIAEQMAMLRPKNFIRTHDHTPDRSADPESAVSDSSTEDLSEDPHAALARSLTSANASLLEARTSLAMIKRDSPHDRHITDALRAVGELRFALHEKEI